MRKLALLVCFMLVVVPCFAQCVGEIKDVIQDEARGTVVVQTEYALNGKVVQQGEARYNEGSGTNSEIIAKAKEDVETHCENLIRRIDKNMDFRKAEMLKRQKELTTPIITSIKSSLVGQKKTVSEVTDTYKEKQIKVTYDEKNSVSNFVAVVE